MHALMQALTDSLIVQCDLPIRDYPLKNIGSLAHHMLKGTWREKLQYCGAVLNIDFLVVVHINVETAGVTLELFRELHQGPLFFLL